MLKGVEMIKLTYIKTDIKKLFREPIMALLFLIPIMFPLLFRLLVRFLVPFILEFVSFDFANYQHYVLATSLIINAMMLSIVMGFTMIDDRDNRIVELMNITPLGKAGYVVMRLSLVFIFVFLYSIYSYFVLGIYIISIYTLLYLTLILSIYSSVLGLVLFNIASDKVNGLTYAKGLNIIMLFAYADLLDLKWLDFLASVFPPYWITQIIANPTDVLSLAMGLITSTLWFVLFLAKTKV